MMSAELQYPCLCSHAYQDHSHRRSHWHIHMHVSSPCVSRSSADHCTWQCTRCHLCLRPVSNLQDYIGTLPAVDRAEAFGQHPNADIAYQIEDSWLVLESLLSLQPQTALAAGGRSREDTVGAICADLLDQVHLYMLDCIYHCTDSLHIGNRVADLKVQCAC